MLHARAVPGNPYDGHTLRGIIEDTQRLTGREIERAYVDKGYHGHDVENPRRVSTPSRSDRSPNRLFNGQLISVGPRGGRLGNAPAGRQCLW